MCIKFVEEKYLHFHDCHNLKVHILGLGLNYVPQNSCIKELTPVPQKGTMFGEGL